MKELNTGDVRWFFDYNLEDFIKLEITKIDTYLNGERRYYAKVIDDGIAAYTYSKTGGMYPRRLDEWELHQTKKDAIKYAIVDIEDMINELHNELDICITNFKDVYNALKNNERLLNKLEGEVQ